MPKITQKPTNLGRNVTYLEDPGIYQHRPQIAWKGIIDFPQFVSNRFKIYIILSPTEVYPAVNEQIAIAMEAHPHPLPGDLQLNLGGCSYSYVRLPACVYIYI